MRRGNRAAPKPFATVFRGYLSKERIQEAMSDQGSFCEVCTGRAF